MRNEVFVGAVLTLAALAQPIAAMAQKFQEPTREELQMTSDPKAPGAPAVFLYREETTDNRNHYVSFYARIKVLTELGKEWATVEVPYIAGSSATPIIDARTIHSDGAVIPLVGKAEDLLVVKTNKDKVKAAVFNLPSVEVGSILEYKWTIPLTGGKVSGVLEDEEAVLSGMLAGSTPEWEVQQPIYVHKEHFYWNPRPDLETVDGADPVDYFVDGERAHYLLFSERLPAGFTTTRSPKYDFTLDIHDVPPFDREANAPPEEAFHYRVRFYRTPYLDAGLYWDNELKRWSRQLDQYAAQTSTIHAAANQLTVGADTLDAKARKLYDAVQALDNSDFSRAKNEAERKQLHLRAELKKAEGVWNEKSGSGNDIAALYLALARAAGLQADGLKVADRSREIFDPNYLSLNQLDDLLVVLHIDGHLSRSWPEALPLRAACLEQHARRRASAECQGHRLYSAESDQGRHHRPCRRSHARCAWSSHRDCQNHDERTPGAVLASAQPDHGPGRGQEAVQRIPPQPSAGWSCG